MSCGLIEHFDDLPDPRVRGRTDYPLIEIVFLCNSAIIYGFDGWEATEPFEHYHIADNLFALFLSKEASASE